MTKFSFRPYVMTICLAFLICLQPMWSQTIERKGVMLCLHDFSIGDERTAVLAAANDGLCSVSPQNKAALRDTGYLLTAKSDSSIVYGVLGFKNDRLTSIEKHWDVGVHDEVGFAEAMFALLRKLESDGNTTCKLVTSETKDPSVSVSGANFKCGTTLVGFNIMKVYGTKQVSIIEIQR